MDLTSVRKEIDLINSEILKLLNRRMEMALISKKFKIAVTDSLREKEVLAFIKKYAVGLVQPDFCERLFGEIMEESKRLQLRDFPLVGFQGEHGAYGEAAARKFHDGGAFIPCETFGTVFEGVASGGLDFGILPVENVLGGTVTQVNELLVETDLFAVGEIYLPVHHCLLALPETDYRNIRVVYSHPQALAQCRGFLKRHNLEGRPYYDTAGAAKMLFHERSEATAVIAGLLCAKLYHLDIIKENIEDDGSNVTRFLVLARKPYEGPADKCSIIFSTENRAGALFGVLKAFAERNINLSRIESMPLGRRPGHYAFFLDFQGSEENERVGEALAEAEALTVSFRVLGHYRGAVREPK